MSMVVFEQSAEKEESKTPNEQPTSKNSYYALRRSKDPSKKFSLHKIVNNKWVKLDEEVITDSLSWDDVKYSNATLLFYARTF